MKILFLHGLESKPGGSKPKALAAAGHEVIEPQLSRDDWQGSVDAAKDAYEETIVPASKVARAIELIGQGNKVFFVIAFTNGISYLDMSNAIVRLGFNARTDRGALELNHYAFIPLDQFKTAEPLNIMD